jgi:hypothetical protein
MSQYIIKNKNEQQLGNTYSGKLIYDDDGNYLICPKGRKEFNLSKALRTVYYHQSNNHINIKISDGCKVLFYEDGILYKKRDQYQLYSYFVNGKNLEEVLFFSTDKDIEIALFAEALEEIAYGNDRNKK